MFKLGQASLTMVNLVQQCNVNVTVKVTFCDINININVMLTMVQNH